jgi:hypothetical protein
MGPFDYAVGLISILVGLALADVATSLHKLLRHVDSTRWDGRVLLSVAFVIIKITGMWFAVWQIRAVKEALSFPFYLSVFLEFMVLFLVCAACLPDEAAENCDLGAFYEKNRRYLWSLFALFQISFFFHWIYFVGFSGIDRAELVVRGSTVLAPLIMFLLLRTIRSRGFHYVVLLVLIGLALCEHWALTLAS